MKHLFRISILFFLFYGCAEQQPEGTAVVSGNVSGADDEMLYLEELTPSDLIRVDSVKIGENGRFSLSCQPDETGIYLVKRVNGRFITVILDKGDHVEVIANDSDFSGRYRISGNEESKVLQEYFFTTSRNQHRLDSLSKVFRKSTSLPDFYRIKVRLDSSFQTLFTEQQNFATQMIHKNPGSLASLLIFNQHFAGKKLFTPENNTDLMLLLDSLLMKNYPGNSHVEAHHRRVEGILKKRKEDELAMAKLAPGMPAPQLNLPDTSGKYISLQSLRGQVVLLCFWATYSPESRARLQRMKEIYRDYHAEGFQIYAVSLDFKKAFWANVLRMERFPWINVSDLKGRYSPVTKLYRVSDDIPYFYLIDKTGKILVRSDNLNEVEGVLKKLPELTKRKAAAH